jgi:sporulation integral membrane protein YlbJ
MVIGVGFLHSAKLGFILAVIHYASAIITGFLMRNPKKALQPLANSHELQIGALKPTNHASSSVWKLSLSTMRQAYLQDGRPFGKLLGDSVTSSVQTLMLIGGYMMIFSVLINVVNITHLTDVFRPVTHYLLGFMNVHTDTTPLWLKGFLEIHLGAYAFSQAQGLSLLPQMALLSAFLGWGGLSAHAQVAGFHQKTDARYLFFFQSRTLHAVIALVLTVLLWKPLQLLTLDSEPSFLWLDKAKNEYSTVAFPLNGESAWGLWGPMLTQFLLLFTLMLIISTFLRTFNKKAIDS